MGWSQAVIVASAILLAIAECSFAELIISQWSLGVSVQRGFPDIDSDGTHDVTNPFQDRHLAWLPGPPPSSAQATYDFAWSADSGAFSITAAHAAADISGSFLRSLSSGNIWLTPSVDTLITATGNYDYTLPVSLMGANIALSATNTVQPQIVYFSSADGVFLQPGSGSLTLGGQGILPAGIPARIHYDFILDTYGATGTVASGNGNISFTLQPVPEPGAACLLLVSVFLFQPRRKGRARRL